VVSLIRDFCCCWLVMTINNYIESSTLRLR
jgi:hypothetical protein